MQEHKDWNFLVIEQCLEASMTGQRMNMNFKELKILLG